MKFFGERFACERPARSRADGVSHWLWYQLIRIACLSLFVGLVPTTVAGTRDEGRIDALAKCLTTKRATMYGSVLCSHCDDQKKLFGSSFEYVKYVECSIPFSRQVTPACQAAGIRFTPTWIFADGGRSEGMQTLEQLGKKTGCPLQ